MKSLKRIFAFSLNGRDPQQAAAIRALDAASNQAELIKRALFAYLDQGEPGASATDQDVNGLRARIAWLEQNQYVTPAITAGDHQDQAGQPVAVGGGPALSETFLAAVRKTARPGIRLE